MLASKYDIFKYEIVFSDAVWNISANILLNINVEYGLLKLNKLNIVIENYMSSKQASFEVVPIHTALFIWRQQGWFSLWIKVTISLTEILLVVGVCYTYI